MTAAERYQKSVEIFNKACDLPANERNAFVAEACSSDAKLRRAVETLLEHDIEACDAVVSAERGDGLRALVETTSGVADPVQIGKYQIVGRIGQGGMGVVFEARQDHPRRTVALKVLHTGMGQDGLLERFRREADFLGQLQHPGIAQVFDAGVGDVESALGIIAQQPYIAMELIKGVSLRDWGREPGRTLRQRLEMVAQICDALEHAHQKGVVHRDLKPGNILVGDTAQPKILDFGIARMTNGDHAAATLQTQTGQLLGTVPYMSPEQVAGDSRQIDARTDVYALGVLLYELLCDRLPYDIRHRSIAEAARVIREEEPTRLSQIDRSMRGDLDTIVGKALDKDRERRYQSADALAADIRRYLNDQPIEARPASAVYNLRKFARRNRGLVGGMAATFIVLLLGAAGTSLGWAAALRSNEKLERTVGELAKANEQLQESNTSLQSVTEFQSAQLTDIDVPMMGVRLRDRLLNSVAEDRRAGLESRLAEINFVDTAREMLDETIFRRAIDAVETQFDEQPVLQARLLQDVAMTMRSLGLYEAAKTPQDRATEIRRRVLGVDHRDTIDSIHESSILAMKQGAYDEAERLAREALAIANDVFGEDAIESLVCLGTVSDILRFRGDLDHAETLARRALVGISKSVGATNPRMLHAESALAAILMRKGDFETSVEYFRAVVDGYERELGPDHSSTLSALENLSNALEAGGKLEESAELAEKCYQARRRVLGDDHPDTLSTLMEFGARLARQGRLEEAEEKLTETLERRRVLLGGDHPNTINAIDALASVIEERGRFADAEALFKEALDRRRRIFGDDHAATLRSLGNYGYILNCQGKSDAALPIYRETLDGLRKAYGNDHPHTLTSIGNLASLLSGLGQNDEAEELYRESLEGRRRTLGDDHPSTLNAVYGMGDMLRRTGKLEEAEPYCRQALEGYRRVGGDNHIGTLYSLTSLGNLLLDQDKPAEAEPLFRDAVERRRRINGDEHPQTQHAIRGLANALERQDRWSDAEEWRRTLLQLTRHAEPQDEYATAEVLVALGCNLLNQGKYGESEPILRESLTLFEHAGRSDDRQRWVAQGLLAESIGADPERRSEALRMLDQTMEQLVGTAVPFDNQRKATTQITNRLAELYETWGLPEKAKQWRSGKTTASAPNADSG